MTTPLLQPACVSPIMFSKVSDKWAYANSVDADQTAPCSLLQQQSDQGLYCLPFHSVLYV